MTNKPMLSVEREVIEKALRDALTIRFDTDSHVTKLRSLLDQPACTTPSGKTCPGDGVDACKKCPTAQHQDEPVACAHEWTDDGEYLLVCTACGAQEDHNPGWRDMSTAPRDGTMLRLLVEFEEHSTEDADEAPTIGANNFDNDGVDEWKFSGWCWTHDHFTEGRGVPVGWLPMLDEPSAEQPAPVAVDTERLDFILCKSRTVTTEILPDGYALYVEEGLMGDKVYPHVKASIVGKENRKSLQRQAIDMAITEVARLNGGKP